MDRRSDKRRGNEKTIIPEKEGMFQKEHNQHHAVD